MLLIIQLGPDETRKEQIFEGTGGAGGRGGNCGKLLAWQISWIPSRPSCQNLSRASACINSKSPRGGHPGQHVISSRAPGAVVKRNDEIMKKGFFEAPLAHLKALDIKGPSGQSIQGFTRRNPKGPKGGHPRHLVIPFRAPGTRTK